MSENTITVRVADYATSIIAGLKSDSEISGQDFKEKILDPVMTDDSKPNIILDFDGIVGITTTALAQIFYGLVFDYGLVQTVLRIEVKSDQRPTLLPKIARYIEEAERDRTNLERIKNGKDESL